ncbi:MAG: isochorismatase family protein [Tissierellia bacterium]|nr:isochorismatase family protein [Tissierellia bacterium]
MENRIEAFFFGEGENISTFENKDKTCLLVIDLQQKLMPSIDNAEQVVKNTEALIEAFDIYDMKKVVTEQYPKGLGESIESIKKLVDDENIYQKTSFDSITEEVYNFLEGNDIKNVIIAGAESHVCVFQTVRRLLLQDRHVFVVEDAVGAYDSRKKKLGIKAMRDMGAAIVNTEMVLFDLAEDSKSEHFKEISNLVKKIRS